MIVCICHRVSDRDIARATREGCADFEALQDELCVATACGACHDCARKTFDEHLRAVTLAGLGITATVHGPHPGRTGPRLPERGVSTLGM
jgi:bacterioferritin-associated ferredoxin